MINKKHTVLLTLCGTSPAVISETVWALAQEKPSVVPDRIVTVTTGTGRKEIEHQLFESGVWERLRKELHAKEDQLVWGITSDDIRLLPAADRSGDLQDITTVDDNAAFGDCMLRNLREFTEDEDCHLILSVAGGRKTMSVLAALSMTLVGRHEDRICHVLVNPPFDSPQLQPRFYFPDTTVSKYKIEKASGQEEAVLPTDARITLAEIPFVRTRYLFNQHYAKTPAHYMELVGVHNESIKEMVPEIGIELVSKTRTCRINGQEVKLPKVPFLLYWMLCERRKQGGDEIRGQQSLADAFLDFVSGLSNEQFPGIEFDDYSAREEGDRIRKDISALNRALRTALGESSGLFRLCTPKSETESGVYRVAVPPEKIIIRGSSVDH